MAGIDSYTKLMLHMNGTNDSTTFTDSEPTPKTVTANGNAKISTAQSKFGGASGYFDGSGDYVSCASHSDFAYGTGAFTVDFWFRISTAGRTHILYSHGGSNDGAGGVLYASSGNNVGYFASGSRMQGSTTIVIDTWYHVAFVGNGGADGSRTLKLYLNGVQECLTYTYNYNFPARNILVGANESAVGECILGYMDEFRVSKGIARWTANFTPPTEAYNAGEPIATNVTFTGTMAVGETLTGSYTYSDEQSDPEGTSTFRWLRNDVAIDGATSITYTLVTADRAKIIKFEVTPISTLEPYIGTAEASNGVVLVYPNVNIQSLNLQTEVAGSNVNIQSLNLQTEVAGSNVNIQSLNLQTEVAGSNVNIQSLNLQTEIVYPNVNIQSLNLQIEVILPLYKLKYWNGSAWLEKPLKYWNGSSWESKVIKYWNGSSWAT